MPKHVLIVGAGLVGSLAAVYFARRGWRVSVYERRPDPRAAGYIGGRSINLALSARGLWGLAGVDLDRTVLERDAIPMPGRMIHPAPPADAAAAPLGNIFQPYSKNPADAINSVSRGGLNLTLIHAAAAAPGVELVFDRRCLDIDLDRCRASFVDDTRPADPPTIIEADLIFGGDGAFSAVRSAMQKTDRFEYSQSYLEHGYKELLIPSAAELGIAGVGVGKWGGGGNNSRTSETPKHASSFALDPNALHIWPRGGSMMIALPNRDGSFTCTLFWPFAGDHSFAQLEGNLNARKLTDPHAAPSADEQSRVLAHFRRHYPDAVPLMPTLVHDFFANPTSSLVTVRCAPWFRLARDGKRATVLAGDAAHAIVPFYGQGMNAGFEDVRILAECLDRARGSGGSGDLAAALAEYHALRKPNADAIADMAIENFTEMRDKVGSPAFRYRKRVEQAIHDAFPDQVAPQYNLVSFSTVPYAEARRRGRELDAVLDRVIERVGPDSPAPLGDEHWKREVAAAAAPLLG